MDVRPDGALEVAEPGFIPLRSQAEFRASELAAMRRRWAVEREGPESGSPAFFGCRFASDDDEPARPSERMCFTVRVFARLLGRRAPGR
jgi:hypothetical protein